jgi:hypothetical protein
VTAEIFIHCDLLVQQFFYLQVNNLKAQTILTTSTHVSDNVTAPVFAISNLENFREGGSNEHPRHEKEMEKLSMFLQIHPDTAGPPLNI